VDEMKLPPESADLNLSKQNFVEQDRAFVPNSLENLYNLLDELASEDNQLELTTLQPDLNSTSVTVNTEKESKGKSLKSSTKATNSVAQSFVNISKKSLKLIEGEIIEPKSSSTQLDEDLSLSNSDRQNNPSSSNTVSASWLNADSLDREEIAKIYVSQQWIIEKERQINELASSLNSLIPLIVEVSKTQANTSQDYILKAIVPVIDRVIKERSAEDSTIMADAIANLLPGAIKQEIKDVPESIGKAIAPELALSIKEQIKLDENAIALALGSEMGKAIKTQIAIERDAMVDALYPVIGSTISKYMGEVVQSINEKVDAALSPVGIQRKIRARIQGISEAELIIQESVPSSIRAIFLIHKTSGLVIRELQPEGELRLESDLLAGMLTAIRSFANDCIVANSELDRIDYDDFQILFETAGYCYLAVVVNGEPIRQFRDRMRTIFSQIVMAYGNEIENYQGDPRTIPDSLQLLLEKLVERSVKSDYNKPPTALYWLAAIFLGSILIPLGIIKYRGSVARSIEKAVAIELDTNPQLSVYRITPEVKKGKLTLTGRVSSTYLQNLAAQTSDRIGRENNLNLNNQIVAVNVPVDPTVTAQEVARTTKILNQKSPVLIKTTYQEQTVTIEGLILDQTERNNLLNTFTSIPGVEKAVFVIQQELPTLATRIYFPTASSEFSTVTNSAKIAEIKQFLNKYPLIKLRIIGHSDRRGAQETNILLGQARANSVYQTLITQDIAPQRLEVANSLETSPDLTSDRPLWLSRCVRFESFITEKTTDREVGNVHNFQKNLFDR
jgi:outer membrane protein OmpA-like peptidoglycan-associated protein